MFTRVFTLVSAGLFGVAGALAAGMLPMAGAASPQIGTAAAVNPDTTITPPDAPSRTLQVGAGVAFRERVETSAEGRTQILFVDESALTIGPGSDLVLDEFVYDPASQTGRIAVSLGSGIMRYIGGRISKQGGVALTTPHGTIGIRGGIFDAIVGGPAGVGLGELQIGDETWAAHKFGIMTCSNGQETAQVTNSAFLCVVSADGVDVIPIPPAWHDAFFTALTNPGTEGQGGTLLAVLRERLGLTCGSSFATNDPNCRLSIGDLIDLANDKLDPETVDSFLDGLPEVDGGGGGGCPYEFCY